MKHARKLQTLKLNVLNAKPLTNTKLNNPEAPEAHFILAIECDGLLLFSVEGEINMTKISRDDAKIIERYWMQLDQLEKWLVDAPKDEKNTLKFKHTQMIVKTLRELYETLDEDLKTIIRMRYWEIDECNEWEDIADQLYVSRFKALRRRDRLLLKTCEAIGWV